MKKNLVIFNAFHQKTVKNRVTHKCNVAKEKDSCSVFRVNMLKPNKEQCMMFKIGNEIEN